MFPNVSFRAMRADDRQNAGSEDCKSAIVTKQTIVEMMLIAKGFPFMSLNISNVLPTLDEFSLNSWVFVIL
jgi:hypothetical protein